MTNICKYYKHPKGCTCKDPFKCLEQLCSNPMICTSNLYYAMGLEQECEELKSYIKLIEKYNRKYEAIIRMHNKLFDKIRDITIPVRILPDGYYYSCPSCEEVQKILYELEE